MYSRLAVDWVHTVAKKTVEHVYYVQRLIQWMGMLYDFGSNKDELISLS